MRFLYYSVASISLVLGIVGIFLPLLPTTPFILLSAYCYAKSSPRMHHWLLYKSKFGPMIRQWQEHRSMQPGVKKRAILFTATTFAITILFFVSKVYLQFMLLFMAVVLISFIARIPSHIPVEVSTEDKA